MITTAVVPRPWRRRARRWVFVLCVVVAVGGYVGRAAVLRGVAGFLDVSDPPQPVDCVLILGGGTETRPFVAGALYSAGLAKQVLVTAPTRSPSARVGIAPPDEEIAGAILRHSGVPERDIVVLDGLCNGTRDEAQALGRFLERHPEAFVGVVTSPYHTRRTRLLFRKVLGDRANRLRFLAAPTDGFDASNWWHYEAGIISYVNEYVKLTPGLLGY